MARSHPPTLLTLAERTLREECGIERGDVVLAAVSGGGDSIALLHALSRLAKPLGIAVVAHGVDHGLRPEAAAELDLAEALARRFEIPFQRSRAVLEKRGNLQAAARNARREALRQAARASGCDYIATAHHADDRAETLLIRMLRGSGPRGLAVLPAKSGTWIRPLIRVRKSQILAHLTRHALRYACDPSNSDPRFLRTRVRMEVLPLLESLSPGVVDHLNALADALLAGPPPVVLDEKGEPLALARAHVSALGRIRALKLAGARVRLPGGRELAIDVKTGGYALVERSSESDEPD